MPRQSPLQGPDTGLGIARCGLTLSEEQDVLDVGLVQSVGPLGRVERLHRLGELEIHEGQTQPESLVLRESTLEISLAETAVRLGQPGGRVRIGGRFRLPRTGELAEGDHRRDEQSGHESQDGDGREPPPGPRRVDGALLASLPAAIRAPASSRALVTDGRP